MSYTPVWDQRAIDGLKRIQSPQSAAAIDAAVQFLATSYVGDVRFVDADDGLHFRLYVDTHYVRFTLDHDARELHVWGVFRAS